MTLNRNSTAAVIALSAVALGIGVAVVVTVGSGSDRVAAAATAPTTDTVSVSGTGSVEGVPDTLVANLRVHVRDSSVQAALNDTAVDARQVITSLRGNGVPASDIRTTDVSLDPDYNNHGVIDGYNSSETLNVRMHPLTRVGVILSSASSAAGNAVSVEDLSFDIADNTALLAGARASAFANAKAAASQYAKLGGTSLSRVLHITAVVHNATPIYDAGIPKEDFAARSLRAAVPIRPGQQKVTVTVKVIWALA
jgi:uncharacterized protein